MRAVINLNGKEYSGTILRMESVDARCINGERAGLYYDLTLELDRWIKVDLNCIPEDWINFLPV